jgi:hypothetical protein
MDHLFIFAFSREVLLICLPLIERIDHGLGNHMVRGRVLARNQLAVADDIAMSDRRVRHGAARDLQQ